MDTLIKVETTVLKIRATTLARHRAALDCVANESSKLSSEAQIELELVRRHLRIEHDEITAELAERPSMFGAEEDVSDVAQPGGFQRWTHRRLIGQLHGASPDGGG